MILKFHTTFCNTLAQNSTGQLKTEVQLTGFNNVHLICLKQFHEKPVKDEIMRTAISLPRQASFKTI